MTPSAEAVTTPSTENTGTKNSQKMALAEPNIGPGMLHNKSIDEGAPVIEDNDTVISPMMGPAGSTSDIADFSESDQISVYTVHPGDTLKTIADMFDVSTDTIIAANGLTAGKPLVPGTIIYILPMDGELYIVKKGDTLKSIAKKFSKGSFVLTASDVAFNNDIASDDDLNVGDTLVIPNPDFSIPAPAKNNSTKTSKEKTPPSGFSLKGIIISPVPGGYLTQKLHFGGRSVDIGAPTGTSVVSVADGVVLATINYTMNGYGKYIVVQHEYKGKSYQTLYAHLSKIIVTPGQTVTQGQKIGEVGNTGHSTGPHCHFETRGAPNPFGYAPYKLRQRL